MFEWSMYLPNIHDPFKPPARRWLRADYLQQHGRVPSQTDDDAPIWAAWQFLCQLTRCGSADDRAQLAQLYPHEVAAFEIHALAPPLCRAEMEARLLADEPDAAIARKLGLAPAAVGFYHDLFFNVRPYLEAEPYIYGVVLDGKVYTDFRPDDYELLLKVFGYAGGGLVVDDFLNHLAHPPVVSEDLDALDLPVLKELRHALGWKVLVLAQTTPAAAIPLTGWLTSGRDHVASRRGFGAQSADELGALAPILDPLAAVVGGGRAGGQRNRRAAG